MEDLNLPVGKIKGIGPKTEESLEKAGVFTLRDLVYFFPRAYEDLAGVAKIAMLRPENVQVVGRVKTISQRMARSRRMSIVEATIEDESGAVRVTWFNQSYRAKQLIKGKEYVFVGKYGLSGGGYQLVGPRVVELGRFEQESKCGDNGAETKTRNYDGLDSGSGEIYAKLGEEKKLVPVYPMRAGVKSEKWQKIIAGIKADFFVLPDLLPEMTGVKAGTRKKALYIMHFPKKKAELAAAKRYLAFEELFVLILAARMNRDLNKRVRAQKIPFEAKKTQKIVKNLPFELTKAQRIATWEILQDLEKDLPMNRLLQGDVGSGKTVVAALAAAGVVNAGGQVAILAPTAILATQHAESLSKILQPLGIDVALLTGATKNKAELKSRIMNGEVGVVVGTHALLTDDTRFLNLSLCVVDEQHRFGTLQRQKLLLKSPEGLAPHMLAMTATPIPRSLQLTVFGDLDVSVLAEMPSGRKKIETKILHENETSEVIYKEIREKVGVGEQVYWICKSIEGEDETLSVATQAAKLKKEFLKFKIGILHGKMKEKEKDAVMSEFASGKIQILVSTTVVEVGVNVPNATLMVISDAERYGLAQLHQLRGRVGRGEKASKCFLVTSGEGSYPRRLTALARTTSGFELAEMDLSERGPGEIYGSLQHGVMDLKIASFADVELINKVSDVVMKFLQSGEDVLKYKELAILLKKYQQLTTLN